MDTFARILRRAALALAGFFLLGLLSAATQNNTWLVSAMAIIFLLPVLTWALRPRELKSDSLEDTLWYSLFPSVAGMAVSTLAAWLLFDIALPDYGLIPAAMLVGFVGLAHVVHTRLRRGWARTGYRPRWANGLLTGLATAGGVLATGTGFAGPGDDSSSLAAGSEDRRINPTTGLPMMGSGMHGFDAGGNSWMQSPSHSDSGFSSNPSDPL